MRDLLGQPIKENQRAVHILDNGYGDVKARTGTVQIVDEQHYKIIFDQAPGNVRGSTMTRGSPVIVNVDGIKDKYPENFL